MSLREKNKRKTEKKIFEVSSRLFREKGFENTTVDEITEGAGIAKGTFFNYFPTKADILMYFWDRKAEFFKGEMAKIRSKDIPTREKIKALFEITATAYEEDRELVSVMAFEYMRRKYTQEGRDDSRVTISLREILQDGVEQGDIRETTDIRAAAEVLAGIYYNTLLVWLRAGGDYSFSGDVSRKVDQVFDGIGEGN